ncbi:unnamed protein product [Caenorhabditis nigoni]
MIVYDGKRLNETDDVKISDNMLVIESPGSEAAGRYTCIAENKAGRSEKDMIVEVQVPPKMKQASQTFDVEEGGTLTLECPIENPNGARAIYWSTDTVGKVDPKRSQISGDGTKLFIIQAADGDADRYTCRAHNEAGSDSSVFTVNLLKPPTIPGEAFSTTEIVSNTTMELNCQPTGKPDPEITWLLDGKPLLPGMANVRFEDNNKKLFIDYIKPSQEGRYTCRADNQLGRAEQDTYVEISEPPRVVMASDKMRVVEGRQTTIRCEVFGEPEPKVSWLKDGEPYTSDLLQHSTRLSYLHLREATLQDGGKYTCIGTNKAGEARTTTEVEILVAPTIEDEDRVIYGKEGKPVQIICKASGTPYPTITWKKNGKELDEHNSVLTISNATREADGKYSCMATNEAGSAVADFLLDVYTRPSFHPETTTFNIIEGHNAKIECKVDGHPKPTITWLKAGRSLNMDNVILSPRGDTLMILKSKRVDAGLYTCVAENTFGANEQDFKVNVFMKPYIEEAIDQTPKAVAGEKIDLKCPVLGNPTPEVYWKKGDDDIEIDGKHYELIGDVLRIKSVTEKDTGAYTCLAINDAGQLRTNYAVDVIGKPTFDRKGENIYEVIEDHDITMDCGVTSRPLPNIAWYRGDNPLYIQPHYTISEDGSQITINSARLSDGGKYTCRASNEAGSSDIEVILRILVPPRIDKSNIIGNPLAIVARNIYLECPVTGIPQPEVYWTKDGRDINATDSRIIYAQNNETFGIEKVQVTDAGRYTCTAVNRGGRIAHDFNLDVLSPPSFDLYRTQPTIKREGDTITLTCPIKTADDVADQVMDVSWTKDSVALDGVETDNVHISDDGRKLTIDKASLINAGMYTCIALNRAGEATLEFKVEILCTHLATVQCRELENNYIARHMPHVVTTKKPTSSSPQSDAAYREHMRKYEEYLKTYEQGLKRQRDESIRRQNEYWEMRIKKESAARILPTTTTTTPTSISTTTKFQFPWAYNPKFGHPTGASGVMKVKATVQHPTRRFRMKRVRPVTRCFLYDPIRHVYLPPPIIDTTRNEAQPQVAVNQPTILRCPVTGHPFPTIKWLKNGVEVTSDENIRIVEQGQTLQILLTDSAHAGKWSCVAENDAGVKELEMLLDVFTPPKVSVHSENPIKAVGETITLFCNATGNPPPQMKWLKGGAMIFDSPDGPRVSLKGARLDIPHLKKHDVGDYTCQAMNAAGTSEGSISVDVLVPPEINRDGIDMSPRLPASQILTLHCLAQGKPPPKIKWTLNGTELKASKEITIGTDASFIQINNVSLSDKGVYECHAENSAGSDSLMYNVDVVQAPVISNGGTEQVIEGELAVIECLVEGYPAPQVSWLRNGNRVETGVQGVRYMAEGRKLTIIEARSLDSGIYLCSATNEAGSAQQAYTLEVLVFPKIVSVAPETLTPSSNAGFSMPCAVRGYPEPVISWTVNGKNIFNGTMGYRIDADGTLHVEKAEQRTMTFECTAKNDAGLDHLEYKVHTIIAPKIGSSGVRSLNGSEGEQTRIKCDIEADQSEITWTKNGAPLLPSNTIEFQEKKTFVVITSTRLSDQGEYSCTVANKAGNATQVTSLNVGVAPKILERPSTQVVHKGEQVTLWCEASGVPQPSISWYKDEQLLSNTGIDETATTKKKSVIFSSITPSQAGVYTCKAENWVGATEEDVDLIVMISPEVSPERMNVSTNPRQTVFLSCNATGIPEPVISWMRDSNIAIQNNEKYQILGTTLAIRNVLPDDDGFYYCIAKSDAGQKIATRKLIVNKPSDRPAPIWVECDEKGKPKKTEYMIDRGDTPDDNPQLLPWKDVEDSSLNGSIAYRCMPGPRSSRTVLLHAAPQFIVKPKNTTAAVGAVIELRCSAAGPPNPVITWAKDGKLIENDKTEIAYSHLKLELNSTSDSGEYSCLAQNSVGTSTVSAFVTVDNIVLPTPIPMNVKKNVAIITCYEKNQAYSRGVTWEYNGIPMPKNLAGIHFMNNGSLVILDTSSLKEGDLDLYTCKVRNRRRHSIPHMKSVYEEVPSVKTIDRVEVNNGDSTVIDCEVSSDPLTTHVVWTKNDQKMMDDEAIYVLPNNSLVLLDVEKYDEGVYKCVASNSIGKAFDDTKLTVYGVPTRRDTSIDDEEREKQLQMTTTTTTTAPEVHTTQPSRVMTIKSAPEFPTEDMYDGSANYPEFGPTTHDVLIERQSDLHSQHAVVDTPDCFGTIDENGDCVDGDGTHHRLKILSGENKCPEGYAINPRTNVCEDLDECQFHLPCDFECINTEGSYECRCPPGYELADDGCYDINECESVRCEEGRACFNQLGGYECIEDPCPANYTLVDDRYCEPLCENCTLTPIQVHMLAIPSGLPVSHIATLTAYDKSGKVLNDTTYSISDREGPMGRGRMSSGPFNIREVKAGHAQVWTNRILAAGDHRKVRVRAHSDHATNELHAPKETLFLILINVGQYPF